MYFTYIGVQKVQTFQNIDPLVMTSVYLVLHLLTFYIPVFKTFSYLLNYVCNPKFSKFVHSESSRRDFFNCFRYIVEIYKLIFRYFSNIVFLSKRCSLRSGKRLHFCWWKLKYECMIHEFYMPLQIILELNKTDIKVFFAFNFIKN